MDLIWSKVLQVYVRCPKGSRALTLLRGIGRFRRLCGPLAPVIQKVDSAIHWINLYPVDNAISFPNMFPPRRFSWEFLVWVCRLGFQIRILFQNKKCHFPHPFSSMSCYLDLSSYASHRNELFMEMLPRVRKW